MLPSPQNRSYGRRAVAPTKKNECPIMLTPYTGKTRIIVALDYHEHVLIKALMDSPEMRNNPLIAWIQVVLPVGDIAVYFARDTAHNNVSRSTHSECARPMLIYERKTAADLASTIKDDQRRENLHNFELACAIIGREPILIMEGAMRCHSGTVNKDGIIMKPASHRCEDGVTPGQILGYINHYAAHMTVRWTLTPAHTLREIMNEALRYESGPISWPWLRFKTVPREFPSIKVNANNTLRIMYTPIHLDSRVCYSIDRNTPRRNESIQLDDFQKYVLEYYLTLPPSQDLFTAYTVCTPCCDPDFVGGQAVKSAEAPDPVDAMTDALLACAIAATPSPPAKGGRQQRKPRKSVQLKIDESSYKCMHGHYFGLALKTRRSTLLGQTLGAELTDGTVRISVSNRRHEEVFILYRGMIHVNEAESAFIQTLPAQIWNIAANCIGEGEFYPKFAGISLQHLFVEYEQQRLILAEPNHFAPGRFTCLPLPTLPNPPPYGIGAAIYATREEASAARAQREAHWRAAEGPDPNHAAIVAFVCHAAAALCFLARLWAANESAYAVVLDIERRLNTDTNLGEAPHHMILWSDDDDRAAYDIRFIAWYLNMAEDIVADTLRITLQEMRTYKASLS